VRFTYTSALGDYEDWPALARAAEEAGFNAFSVPDSTIFPRTTESTYPYNDTDVIRQYAAATPFIEPMIALTWVAAVTEKLRLYPNVMKVPIRSPIILAKQISCLATLSGGRFGLGAGIGPWVEDFAYNNVSWARRGVLLDECVEIIRGLMTGEFFEFHSDNYDIGPIRINPVPSNAVPIIFGGHSQAALRRAARLGDGWVSVHGGPRELKPMIEQVNRYRDEYGTRDAPFEFHLGDWDFQGADRPHTADDYKRLDEIGATDACVVVPFADPSLTRHEKVDAIRRFGDEIIDRLR